MCFVQAYEHQVSSISAIGSCVRVKMRNEVKVCYFLAAGQLLCSEFSQWI